MKIILLLFSISFSVAVTASTVSFMAKFMERERELGEQRKQALANKDRQFFCPGNKQKGMSLCVREYIKHYKVETAGAYIALTNLINLAATQDRTNKIYDSDTAQIVSIESLFDLQDRLKKEDRLCSTMIPSGPSHLLEVKTICLEEGEQFQKWQEQTKIYVTKKISEIENLLVVDSTAKELDVWKKEKIASLKKDVSLFFNKVFFSEKDIKITKEDIVEQNQTTIRVSCNSMPEYYKKQIGGPQRCDEKMRSLMFQCLAKESDRSPANLQPKDMVEIVQSPLKCFYNKIQHEMDRENK